MIEISIEVDEDSDFEEVIELFYALLHGEEDIELPPEGELIGRNGYEIGRYDVTYYDVQPPGKVIKFPKESPA